MARWGFLTNHALVLMHVALHPRSTLREISNAAGITDRAVGSILRQMEEEELVSRQREGRNNRYWVDVQALLNYQLSGPYTVVELAEQLMAVAKQLQGEGGNASRPAD